MYDDPASTLQECGLVPNATLHLLAKKVWHDAIKTRSITLGIASSDKKTHNFPLQYNGMEMINSRLIASDTRGGKSQMAQIS